MQPQFSVVSAVSVVHGSSNQNASTDLVNELGTQDIKKKQLTTDEHSAA